ncbi:N-acetyltransferase YodP [Sporomusa ovata DSM 2662]|uniref:Beta-lysine acetyltransferase n=1 Tax=Sporomusa ovata TaxID=2378 RepID=A0A0U1L1A2_9FIRM|nr:putative beta-lysine N-acetyltransferase [Sporomusa ovata]EQB27993.1 putative N-acetyltransferase YodP [Sporomusa ovata DSM 2662]CQR72933.1 Beta-lysine acetyltransferase [Sporomusa ovata]
MTLCNIKVEPGDAVNIVSKSQGYHYHKKDNMFSVDMFIDTINHRLKIKKYSCSNYDDFVNYVEYIADANSLSKIIMVAQEFDWEKLFVRGFVLEALHPTFFAGLPGFHIAKFMENKRRISLQWDIEEDIVKQVRTARPNLKSLTDEYEIRSATLNDIPALTQLFNIVFATYPTPLNDAEYLQKLLETNSVFKLVVHHKEIVSVASIDIDYNTKSAELTDCATLRQYEGQGLMSHLVVALEKEAKKLQLITLYTIARAESVGINLVFARNGYNYYGRFVNNCSICGKIEDMNLWSKRVE